MEVYINYKAEKLLNQIANSLFDRDPKNPYLVFFNSTERRIVEVFLQEFMEEIKNEA